jgi:hypothetical protein
MSKQQLPLVNLVENWLNLVVKVAAKNPPQILRFSELSKSVTCHRDRHFVAIRPGCACPEHDRRLAWLSPASAVRQWP